MVLTPYGLTNLWLFENTKKAIISEFSYDSFIS